MMVANKPGHQGERDISRKTIARGMPGVSGVTVVTNARVFYTTRAAAGASGARHSLRPLLSEGAKLPAKLGRIAPREGGVMYLDRHAPLQAGHPVRRDVSCNHEPSLEYWIARSSRAKTRFALLPGDAAGASCLKRESEEDPRALTRA